jgi:hypothetical protein
VPLRQPKTARIPEIVLLTHSRRLYSMAVVSEVLVECENCGLGSLFPMQNAPRLQSFYSADYYGEPLRLMSTLLPFSQHWHCNVRRVSRLHFLGSAWPVDFQQS